MKMKKVTAILLTLILSASTLVGCSGKKATSESSVTSTDTDSSTSAQSSGKTVELTWYTCVDTKMPDEQKVIDELNKYLKEKINVTVKPTFMTASDYMEKMPVKIASGEKFDICFMSNWAADYLSNVSQGACLPLNDLLQSEGKATYDFIPEMMWDAVTVDDNIYGIPSYKEVGTQYGFLINQDLADEYGIDVSNVNSYADMEEVLKQVKAKAPADIIGMTGATFNSAYTWESLVGNVQLPSAYKVNDFSDFQDQSDIFNQYATKEFSDYCTMMSRWFKNGYTPADPVQYAKDQAGRERDDKAGKLFSLIIGYAPSYEFTRAEQMGHRVTYKPIVNPVFTTESAMGGLQVISANSDHPKEAMQFINMLNTDKYVGTLIRHGIEDTHYSKVSDTRLDSTMGGAIDSTNHPYNYVFGWQFGSPLNQVWDNSYPDSVEQSFEDYNQKAVASSHVGFTFNVDKVSTEAAALQSVKEQYLEPLQSGMVDASQIPTFLDALEKAGVQKFMDEAKSQVDAWNQSNTTP